MTNDAQFQRQERRLDRYHMLVDVLTHSDFVRTQPQYLKHHSRISQSSQIATCWFLLATVFHRQIDRVVHVGCITDTDRQCHLCWWMGPELLGQGSAAVVLSPPKTDDNHS
jgi:hypothetical protein